MRIHPRGTVMRVWEPTKKACCPAGSPQLWKVQATDSPFSRLGFTREQGAVSGRGLVRKTARPPLSGEKSSPEFSGRGSFSGFYHQILMVWNEVDATLQGLTICLQLLDTKTYPFLSVTAWTRISSFITVKGLSSVQPNSSFSLASTHSSLRSHWSSF